MVSTATSRLRLNKQGTGDNTNTWGTKLNTEALDLTDEAIAGVETIALTGNHTLTSTNYVSDQARNMGLRFTGSLTSGATITIPAVEKLYFIINDSGQTLTFTAGGTTGAVETGRRKWIACNGTDVYVGEDGADLEYVDATFLPKGGGTMTGKITLDGAPTADLHAATKKYADDLAFTANAGVLPGQGGNSGKYLSTDGTTASWATVDLTTLQPLDSDLTAIAALTTTALGRNGLILNPRFVTNADSPVTAANGDLIICNSSGGAITINMPAAAANQSVAIRAGASAATNNINIVRNGSDTLLGETSLEIDQNFWAWDFIGNTGAWA